MINFEYNTPTKIVFGKDVEKETGKQIKELGAKKVLVHYGGKSAKESGLLDSIYSSLKKEGLSYVSLGGVVPNPRLSKVYEGIELCKKENVDFILAVGGGSVIDSCKVICYGLGNDCDVWDLFKRRVEPKGFFPMGSVLTLAAAGSETSNSTVLTNENGMIKIGLGCELSRPKLAIMNPELTYTLPKYQTMCGVVDIIMHTLERYFCKEEKTMDITDRFAEGLICSVMENARVLMKDPCNYDARAGIMWAGSLSHIGITGCGVTGDWASHRLEHELSGMFDVAHGAGLSAIWGSWARYVLETRPGRFAKLGENIFNITGTDDNEKAILCIKAMESFFKSIEMPISLEELGIDANEEVINKLAQNAENSYPCLGSFKVLYKEDYINIYRLAK